MKKISPTIVAVLVVLVLAGAVLARVAIVSRLSGMPDATSDTLADASANSERPIVMWSVISSPDEDAKGYSYSLVTKQATGLIGYMEGAGVVRFNQSMNLCDQAYAIAKLTFDCAIDERAVLTMRVGDETENGRAVGTFVVDPRELGITPGAVEGYLVPVAVSADKSTIYLGRRVETESYVAGLWRLDVPSGKITEIEYVREKNIYQYDINPTTKQMIGSSFTPPENLGAEASGPSSVLLVDLTSGAGSAFEESGRETVFENPMLSEDKPRFSFYESGGGAGTGRTVVLSADMGRFGSGWEIDGVVRDWFGDIMVVDRGGNLFLYDLATKVETQLTHETDATVEYLGVVR